MDSALSLLKPKQKRLNVSFMTIELFCFPCDLNRSPTVMGCVSAKFRSKYLPLVMVNYQISIYH